jgi:hypothetical protein
MRRTLAALGGLGLAVAFSQFPEYAQQYEQRLGGAVNELRIIVADFDSDAQKFGLSRDAALQHYAASPDAFLVARGVSMERTLARYELLSADLAELQGAGPLQRLAHLNDYFDSDISRQALAAYEPAVPVTPEGFMWAIGGFIAGYFLCNAFFGFLTLPFRWRRGHQPHRRALLWRRRPQEIVVETVTLDEVAEARRQIQRAAEPESAALTQRFG